MRHLRRGSGVSPALADPAPFAVATIDNPFLQLESLWANIIENSWNFCRNLRNASIELSFHALYGTPSMKHIDVARQAPTQTRDVSS